MNNESMSGSRIALIVIIVFLVVTMLCLVFSGIAYFGNLSYFYKLPVAGTVPNLQMATLARLRPMMSSSSEEPVSSEEPRSSEEPSFNDANMSYSDQSLLIGLYSNERRNMNPFGNYKMISATKKQESKEIDNLLQRLHNVSNSGMIGK